jgi:hypothetical protein
MKCVLQIVVPIDAADAADAYRQAKLVEDLLRNPFLSGQLQNEGVRVEGRATVTPFSLAEQP